jgi:hypothetical protein
MSQGHVRWPTTPSSVTSTPSKRSRSMCSHALVGAPMAFSTDETCVRTVLTAPARWGTGMRCPRHPTRELGGHEVLRPRRAVSTLSIGLVLLAMAGVASAQYTRGSEGDVMRGRSNHLGTGTEKSVARIGRAVVILLTLLSEAQCCEVPILW